MKKSIGIFSLLFLALFLAACGTSKSSTTEADASEETGSADSITLISSIQAPEGSDLSNGFDAYLDEIEELSDGEIEFERYYGETLAKAADHLDAVKSGVADIALLLPSYTPGQNPLASIESLPALWENQWAGTRAYRDLYDEFPELSEEYNNSNVEVIGQLALPSYYVIGNTDLSSLEDLKGKSLAASGGQSLLAEELGANSVGIVITETFEAMEKGTVDGALLGLTGSSTYGLHEVADSLWLLPIGSQGGVFGINKDTLDTIPEHLKDVFDEAALKNTIDFHKIYQEDAEENALELYEEADVTIHEASEEDLEELRDIVAETVWADWINSSDRKDTNAGEILERFVELVDEYEDEFEENGLPE